MAASAHPPLTFPLLRAVPEQPPAPDEDGSFSAEGAETEPPLTSEPPLPDTAPLTSEPPLSDTTPRTGTDPSVD